MAEDKEFFLSRWSRLKRAAPQPAQKDTTPAAKPAEGAPAAPLPPVESLTPDSDFSAFMQAKVGDAVRRAALKKLFGDPRFNVPDLFEAYSGDWTGGDPISPELLKELNQARTVLFRKEEEEAARRDSAMTGAPAQESGATPVAEETGKQGEDGTARQDT